MLTIIHEIWGNVDLTRFATLAAAPANPTGSGTPELVVLGAPILLHSGDDQV
ncbi:hypothetical protein [Propionivibrio sp.]|uniref:hypothetical protein n=1 Tax=Propionivibrio sp. TaxID=2212460 RepID=UPI0039E6A97C